MKYLKLKFLLMFFALAMAIPPAWAETVTYTMTLDCNANGNGANDVHWTSQTQDLTWNNVTWHATADNIISTGSTTDVQIGTGTKPARNVSISTSDFSGTIKKVIVTAKTAKDAVAYISISVNGISYKNTSLINSYIDYEGTGTSSGEIQINITQPSTSKALYIKQITVVYEGEGGDDPGPGDDPTPTGSKLYEKVTSASQLVDGKKYIFVYDTHAMGSVPTSTSGGFGSNVTVVNDNGIVDIEGKDVEEFTLGIIPATQYDPIYYTFAFSNGSYLAGAGESSSNLKQESQTTYAKWLTEQNSGGFGVVSERSGKKRGVIYQDGGTRFGHYAKSNVDNSTYGYGLLYVEKDDGNRVATPTFDPAGGNYDTPQSVTISCETDGATIYYTTDGTDPTETSTQYNGAIDVNKTMTIKAIAVADDMENSYVATATYTLPKFVENLTAANALETNVSFKYTGYAEVTYVNGTDAWIRDDAGTGGYLYRAIPSGSSFANGDVLKAGWTATKDEYKGLDEFKDVSGLVKDGTATVEPEVLTQITDADVNKYVKLVNVSESEIVDGSGNAVQLYDKFGTNYTFESGKKYDVVGIVGYYNNLQLHIISITEHGEPTIAVDPTALTLKEEAQTFTVTGENLVDNVGVPNNNHVFNTTYSGEADWGFVKDAQGKVNGTVTVTYTGRELKATDTFVAGTKKSWNPVEEISIPITVTYQPDIYIVGNINNAGWNFGDGNRPMSYDEATGLYTAQLTTTSLSYFMFARKPGQNYGWQGDQNRLFFGAQTDGGNWVLGTESTGNIDINGTTGNQYHPIELPNAGEYTITINPTAKTFTITKVVHQVETPVISPEGGNYNTIQTVTITCATEGAAIHYTTDGTEPTESSATYENPITVDHSMTIKAIAVADNMDNSEVATATYTLPESVNTLAAANTLVKDTEFLFTGDAVVTYHNGDYTFLRDVNATAGGGLIYQSGINLAQGVVLKKGWDAKRADYRGEKEYINAINVESSGNTADFTPFDRTGVAFDDTHMNEYVTFNNVTITSKTLDEGSGKYTFTGTYTDGNRANVDYILHNQFDLDNIEEGRTYNVTGVVTKRDENMQVYPTAVTLVQQNPNMSFAEETVNATFGADFTEPELTKPEGVTVKYSSDNTEVAEVNETTGEVTIKKIGNAKITATSVENDYYTVGTASYNIVVSAGTPTFAYSADAKEVVFGTENPELPTLSNPNSLNVTYTSSKPEVATVATDGKVTIVGVGETTITATGAATGNYNGAIASYTLTVNKADLEVSFNNETPDPITIGDSFTAPVLSEVPEGTTVTYKSSNPAVATVDPATGVVTIVGPGTAKITATVTGANYNETSASYTITVNDVVEALAAPTFSPAAGTYTEPKEVAIACATPGVTIEYSINGGETQTYTKPFLVSENCTVTATAKMGTRTVYTPATSSATYTINAASAATIADDYYFLQSNAAEVSGKYANVAGRRTLNFVADADKQAGTVFRVMTDPDTIGQVETLRSQAVDLQGYANRAMAYVPKVIDLVLSTLANSSLGDPETPGTGILGENGVQLILKKFYEKFDHNLYVEGTEGAYRIYGRTPSMQHVVDFYHENTAQVEEKLPMLEGYINQVLDKIRSKVPAPYDANVVIPFSLKTVRDRIADKYGIALIDPTQDLMGFYRQVLNNKEYVWDFAYQTAMMYVDVIKQTSTYQGLPNEYKLLVEKMEKVRPDTKYYIIERGNELDYISENNTDIISNDPRTFWTLTKRENFTVNVPEANKLNDSYYTTLYTDFAYTLPEGVTAYAVTDIDDNDVAQLAELSSPIAAQTPVLLKANAAGTVNVTLTTAAGNTPETNLLEGPDYLVKTYGITSPTVEAIFNLAAAFVPADMLAEYEYLKLRTSGTVNNKYFWNVNDALEKLTDDCVVRSLAVKDGTLAFSEHWTTETNKAFLVSDTKPVIYLEKETLAAPTFSPVPGSYTVNNGESVTITITAEDGATIYYKIGDGEYQRYNGPITASDDMTIVAKAEKDGMIASDEVTAVYVIDNPTVLPDVPAMKGYYQIKNNGNEKYAHVQGRKTLTFTNAPADKAGTVIWLETNNKGQVQSLRSQAADLQRYADRAMSYVPEIVELVADKLNADGEGNILGENGLDAIMAKFNKSFDHHLYVEEAQGGYRIYGKTPSMQPVVDFYREHTAQVEAKLPMLESFINSALNKLKEKIGGSSVFTPFSLLNIWERMGGTLTKPEDEASTMAFYREVLNNKNYVWDFAYQTAMIYLNNIKGTQTYQNLVNEHPEISQYIDKIDQIRPDFKYYIVADGDKPDFISQGNTDIINNAARTIWTLEERTTFNVNIDENNLFGCPLAGGVGGYATTLYTDFAYELPDNVDDVDVTAYKVTSIEGGKATIEALSGIIPAQTPVLLTAKVAGTVTLKLTTEPATADTTGNLLRGPDYLINVYDLKTDQVQSLFDQIKQKLGQDFYDTYVAQYEYLADLNSGTVNNKYFWGLKESDVEKCSNDGGENCVVRNLSGDKFIDNWKVETNKAFLVTDEYAEITFNTLHGDVNHDGLVNIEDVTDLIDRLLGMPDAYHLKACEYCSDVNKNGTVKIDDVTTLIDILLGIDGSNQATDPQGGE